MISGTGRKKAPARGSAQKSTYQLGIHHATVSSAGANAETGSVAVAS